MVFQVITPRQLQRIEIGRQRIEFLYQVPAAFAASNRKEWLAQLKTEAGFAQIAGVELTLLDLCRYFHQAAGIKSVAQAVPDLGNKADPRILAKAANCYENSAVRRLGYLLDYFAAFLAEGHLVGVRSPTPQASVERPNHGWVPG
jgi:predicted transcriptional regulator of viral defense system